jgi:hypothetical protein
MRPERGLSPPGQRQARELLHGIEAQPIDHNNFAPSAPPCASESRVMTADQDLYAALQAEYQSAVQCERAEWKLLGNDQAEAGQRIAAYARWRAAAERTKTLSITMREMRCSLSPTPVPTSLSQ